ncbi:MAG: GNAT family N-acetyltransferase [Alphaproteobacteria bacterium]
MIRGEHVGLRAIEREDLPTLLTWRNDPSLRQYFRESRELSSDHQMRWYEGTVLGAPDRTRMFAIESVSGGALLGACGLTTLDWQRRHGELSLYIGLDRVYCDSVMAPEAARLLLGHGFRDLGLHRIWVEVYAHDRPKLALMKALGLRHEGTLRDHHFWNGRFWDAHLFASLAPEWLQPTPPDSGLRSPSAGA